MVATLYLALLLGLQNPLPPSLPLEDPLQPSDEMKAFLAQNIRRDVDQLQQVETLVRLLFQENSLNFKYLPETRTAAETFARRSGNCVSFTFLFLSMARQLGVNSQLREVEIAPLWSRTGDIVTRNGHVNTEVTLGGQVYVVDLFPRLESIQIGGRAVPDGRALAHYFSNKGVDQLGLGHPLAAIPYLRRALQEDPTAAFAWANLGAAQTLAGSYAEAERSYLDALKLQGAEMIAMSNLAALYTRQGRTRDAAKYRARVERFQQKNPYYHFGLGRQDYEAGKYREAIGHFRSALRLKSTEHNFHVALARAYSRVGEVEKAADSLKAAVKNAPDDAARIRYEEKLGSLAAAARRNS